ncbi:MAG: LegC family aminotransferase [Verrucomicrobia bacterium]|jgi:aminotransferase in exopolysaccharide biosynthesis|nr:LegC family aminotransferase [Verrucomicrobiota bacterium]MDA1047939.1 LegC family aminotransferase [Verrucomicrobiota bacterium]
MNLTDKFEPIIKFVRQIYADEIIPLHRPVFGGNEKSYLADCIDSNFVSTAGTKVDEFEGKVASFTGTKNAIAVVNGTNALHIALLLAGVEREDEVITQALTFVATCNAVSYLGAEPVFIDVDRDTLGMSPAALRYFLEENAEREEGGAINKSTGRRIKACLPMHTFGMPCRIKEIADICREWEIALVEDAAESLGSFSEKRHTGTFGLLGVISFNGNKIITTGGGGMMLTDDDELARRARHVTTTAKVPHRYEFSHDEIGFNFRLPSLNATLGCAQMERLTWMIRVKERIAARYRSFFESIGVEMPGPLPHCQSNYWLNAIVLSDKEERDGFLDYSNNHNVMTRPIWQLMSDLAMFGKCQNDGLENSRRLQARVVNLPSSVPSDEAYPHDVDG